MAAFKNLAVTELDATQFDTLDAELNLAPRFSLQPASKEERVTILVDLTKGSALIVRLSCQIVAHKHPTDKIVADSYFGSSNADIPEDVVEDVGQLMDTHISTKHITAYLSESLGKSRIFCRG